MTTREYTRVISTKWTESVPADTRYTMSSGRKMRASQLVHGDVLRGGAIVLDVTPASIGTPRSLTGERSRTRQAKAATITRNLQRKLKGRR